MASETEVSFSTPETLDPTRRSWIIVLFLNLGVQGVKVFFSKKKRQSQVLLWGIKDLGHPDWVIDIPFWYWLFISLSVQTEVTQWLFINAQLKTISSFLICNVLSYMNYCITILTFLVTYLVGWFRHSSTMDDVSSGIPLFTVKSVGHKKKRGTPVMMQPVYSDFSWSDFRY